MISSLLLGAKVNNACRYCKLTQKERDFPLREGNKWKIFPTFLLNNKFVWSEASQCQKKQFEKLSSTRLRRLLTVADPDIQMGAEGRFGASGLSFVYKEGVVWVPGPLTQIRHWTTALNRRKNDRHKSSLTGADQYLLPRTAFIKNGARLCLVQTLLKTEVNNGNETKWEYISRSKRILIMKRNLRLCRD